MEKFDLRIGGAVIAILSILFLAALDYGEKKEAELICKPYPGTVYIKRDRVCVSGYPVK